VAASVWEAIGAELGAIAAVRRGGTLAAADTGAIAVAGLGPGVRLGDRIAVAAPQGASQAEDAPLAEGEIVAIGPEGARAMVWGASGALALGARVWLLPDLPVRPGPHWTGRVIDAFGRPLDGAPLPPGPAPAELRRAPPPAHGRRALGPRLATGLAALDTMLPLVRGQRIGLFAGSGVGKSRLLADLARGVEADRVVVALIGERGRELNGFLDEALGPGGRARAVVVAATSDQSALLRRRAAFLAMAVAESFRDRGEHVLFLCDSLTRFAEAHREIALTAGEPPSLRGFPPSTVSLLAGLCERAGPGAEAQGDITAVFTVLVAGSDMEEPVADMVRGILDGHVVLDRAIAERGRFPAIDVRRSVSRALPGAASPAENALIGRARRLLGLYEEAAPMLQAGLYQAGADPGLDEAVRRFPALDAVFAARPGTVAASFAALAAALGEGGGEGGPAGGGEGGPAGGGEGGPAGAVGAGGGGAPAPRRPGSGTGR
jgi:flagellum-specific ATP synthase